MCVVQTQLHSRELNLAFLTFEGYEAPAHTPQQTLQNPFKFSHDPESSITAVTREPTS